MTIPAEEHLKPWQPLTLDSLDVLFRGIAVPVWIAGGYALELAAGTPWRAHADIDVLVLRPHWPSVQRHLADWDIWAADPPGRLRPLAKAETLPPHVHDLWLRRTPADPWQLQVMIDEVSPGEPSTWASRRDPRLTRPLAALGTARFGALRVLAPEIQLFYKARGLRDKDRQDFDVMLPLLSAAQRHWLRRAIETAHGSDHPWLSRL